MGVAVKDDSWLLEIYDWPPKYNLNLLTDLTYINV